MTPNTLQLEAYPRRAFVACMFAACATGSGYGFSVYASAIQYSLQLSDSELSNINTIPFVLGFICPPLVGRVLGAFGPARVLLLGGSTSAASQVLMFLLASGNLPVRSPPPRRSPPTAIARATVFACGARVASSAALSRAAPRGTALARPSAPRLTRRAAPRARSPPSTRSTRSTPSTPSTRSTRAHASCPAAPAR